MGQYFYIEDKDIKKFEKIRQEFNKACGHYMSYLIDDEKDMPKSCKECNFTSYNINDDDFTDCAFVCGKCLDIGKYIHCPLKLKEGKKTIELKIHEY